MQHYLRVYQFSEIAGDRPTRKLAKEHRRRRIGEFACNDAKQARELAAMLEQVFSHGYEIWHTVRIYNGQGFVHVPYQDLLSAVENDRYPKAV